MKFLERYISRQAQKPAKRSLLHTYLISLMSLCLSVCMLLGTTMAWFTSGVEVAQNEIYVGTLDVDLLLKQGENHVSLKPDGEGNQHKVFAKEDMNWYPDHVEVRTLTVVDQGEIPFTYRLTLTPGMNEKGEILDKGLDEKVALSEEELNNFRSQFLVYAKIGEAAENTISQDLIEANGWTLIGNLYEIYTGELSVFAGESKDMDEVEEDGKKIRSKVYSIAVRMNHDPVVMPKDLTEETLQEYTPNDFQGYTLNFNIKLVANQFGAPETVKDEAKLAAMLEAGRSVKMGGSIVLDNRITLTNGVLDGGNVSGTDDVVLYLPTDTGADCAIMTHGGTIKNLKIVGDDYKNNRAIGSGSSGTMQLTRNLYIDNVVIDNVMYAINGSGDGKCKVIVTNSEIYGWISYANISSFDFVDCTLGAGDSYDGYMPIYGNTSFTNCTFVDFDMCGRDAIPEGATLTITNCTNDGQKVTATNFRALFMESGDDADFNKLKNCTIMVDGVKVNTDSWTN